MKRVSGHDDKADVNPGIAIAASIATMMLGVVAAHETLRLATSAHGSIWLAMLLSAMSGLAGLFAAYGAQTTMRPAITGAAAGAVALLVGGTMRIPISSAVTLIILAVSLGAIAVGVATNLQKVIRRR